MSEDLLLENTEVLEESSEADIETIIEVSTDTQILEQIYNDVHIIMVLTILTFCMSCLRGWRKNVVKGVR